MSTETPSIAFPQDTLEHMRSVRSQRIPVILSGDALDIVFQTYLDESEITASKVVLVNKVPYTMVSRFLRSSSFSLQAGMLRFHSPTLECKGDQMIFAIGEGNRIEETRTAERLPFRSDEHVICEIVHPLDAKTILSKNLLDMSAHGLSFASPMASRLYVPGRILPEVKIFIEGAHYRTNAASIVYSRKLMDLSGRLRVQVGLKFISDSSSTRQGV